MAETIKLNINGVLFDIKNEDFSQAGEKGELVINSDNHVIKTKTDYDKYIENVTGERYKAGKEKAEKDAVNSVLNELGIELTDEKKTVKNLVSVYGEKIKSDAKIEPNKKIQELEQRANDAINLSKQWEAKYNDVNSQLNGTLKSYKIDELIMSSFPKTESGENIKTKIPVSDIVLLFKNKYKVDYDDSGKEYVEHEGTKLTNKENLDNLLVKDVLNEFTKGYIDLNSAGGSGSGDNTGSGKPGTLDAFNKEMEGKQIRLSSPDYNREMQKRIKDGTLKV